MHNWAPSGVAEDNERDHQEIAEHEDEHETLPTSEAACGGHCHKAQCRDRDRDVLAHAEVTEGKGDADELGDDGEEIEDKQVADGEHAPETAETLLDKPTVADTRNRAQPDHHLLIDDEHRDQ